MANTFRHVRDNIQSVLHTSKTGIAYEIGDLVYQDTADGNLIKPAASLSWTTDLATTQLAFHGKFAGVLNDAVQSTMAGKSVTVSTSGVFRFDCAALGAALPAGTFIGPAANAGNTALENQKVASVTTAGRAIGRLAEDAPAGATSLKVRIISTVQYSGPVAVATS